MIFLVLIIAEGDAVVHCGHGLAHAAGVEPVLPVRFRRRRAPALLAQVKRDTGATVGRIDFPGRVRGTASRTTCTQHKQSSLVGCRAFVLPM